eukprot:scaffold24390_cov107-Isochrysis_galbana.AAC.5
MQAMIDEFDTDHDGEISFAEFARIMKSSELYDDEDGNCEPLRRVPECPAADRTGWAAWLLVGCGGERRKRAQMTRRRAA